MALVVQKYGGSSVADPERIQAVAARVKRTVEQGNQVIVVVSAMGKTTDGLVKLAEAVATCPSQTSLPCDLDLLLATGEQVTIALLSMALQTIGQAAIALTGSQVRVVTEPIHTRARILHVETDYLRSLLAEGKVIVIAGFQGVALDAATGEVTNKITTLGRGGSDTSAVAIAAAIEADLCEIYTDVPGILTTDPRLVPEAQLMTEITCDEMLELASLGAKVLHPRSVEIARNFGVKLAVRSSWLEDAGTFVLSPTLSLGEPNRMALEVNRFVEGIAIDRNQAKVALLQVPDRPGIAAQLFQALATQGINVDLIIQSIQESNSAAEAYIRQDVNDIAFTINPDQLELAKSVAISLNLAEEAVVTDAHVAKVSIIGAGIIGRPGVAAQMFAALAKAGINIQMISTSEIKVSCVIAAPDSDKAIAALREAFDVPILVANNQEKASAHTPPPVRGVALDINRARLAVRRVPDHPGVAAKLFEYLGQHNISVDMIIQSQSEHGVNDIAFTLPSGDMAIAEKLLKEAAQELGYGDVVADGAIAKVSIVGTGMIQQSGVAAQMFSALAASGINIEMIATSEIKVSCVVREHDAETALKAVHQAFHLS